MPIILSIVLVIGIYLGTLLTGNFTQNNNTNSNNKISNILNIIETQYVDSADLWEIQEKTANFILEQLDPHSNYITASEFNQVNDPLLGKFDGIGVQFRLEKDSVLVVQPISGGPSEKVGIRAGDRIVTVDGDTIVNKKMTNRDVMAKLKGDKGTEVDVEIYRKGNEKLLPFTITRAAIPTWSIDVAFMPTETTGYIKLGKFSATTTQEFKKALKELKKMGMKKLIFDLRGNTGGYLSEATHIADEFLEDGKLIVYTEGKNQPRQSYYSTRYGNAKEIELVILIDEISASASEIVAGAIQDNDRGTIIGRRSFGKGLVQHQMQLRDNSAIRLTIARYYTPTGRSIQKPYSEDSDDYFEEIYNRYISGEMLSADSIHFDDSLKYTTPKGNIVYGGGGIMPTIFVPMESGEEFIYYNKLSNNGLIFRFAFEYADTHREELKKYSSVEDFEKKFKISKKIWNDFKNYVEENEISTKEDGLKTNKARITHMLKSYIARNIYDEAGFYPIFLKMDPTYNRALEFEVE